MFSLSSVQTGLIKKPVGNNMVNDGDDVLNVRKSLSALGVSRDDTDNPIITRGLDSAIKNFQRNNDLKVDGILRPRGETESAMLRRLSEDEDSEKDEGEKKETPPLKPERKPDPPKKEEKPDCADLEAELRDAEGVLAEREAILRQAEAEVEPLEQALVEKERQIEEKEHELEQIRLQVKGMGAAAGAISFGLIGLSRGGPKIGAEAAKKGGLFGAELAEKALIRLELEIAKLQKERDALLEKLKPLREKVEKMKSLVNEAAEQVDRAQGALSACRDRS